MTDSSTVRYQLSDLVIDPSRLTAVPDPGALIAQVARDTTWWLDVLTKTHDAPGIARVRRQIAKLERSVINAQIGDEARLDMAELSRRAERAIGLAIRWGQDHGTIRAQGQRPGHSDIGLPSPTDYAPKEILARGAYAFATLSDDAWEVAITASRAARDLGRSDMVRRATGKNVSGRPGLKMPVRTKEASTNRRNRIREMAASGHNSYQIGRAVGIDPQTVRTIAKEEGIDIPAEAFVKHGKVINPNRLIDETVLAVDGHASALTLLEGRWDDVDRDKIDGWLSSLSDSLRYLQGLRKQLKELTHGN